MKSMKVSSSPGSCDLCQPLVPGKGNTEAYLHNGGGFVGVLKWHFSVVLEQRAAIVHEWHIVTLFPGMDYTLPVHWWLLLLFSLTYYHLSSFHIVLSPSVTSLPLPPCFHSSTCNSVVYLLLHRPQARDDLRFLADGLAGELLQHCHDHQAGGGGQGRFPSPLSCDLFSRLWRWMERWILKFPLSGAIY